MNLASLSTSDWQARAARVRYETRHFIDGNFVDSVKKGRFTVVNPATGAALCEVSAGTKEDIDLAVAAASKAYYSRVWSRKAPRERMAVLAAFSRLIKENTERFALLDTLVHGQADHRHGHHRRAGGGPEFRLLRRAHRQDRRPGHRHRAGCLSLHPARAARGRRLHRAVELSAADGGLEGRAGVGGGKLRGAEAGRAIAPVGAPDGGAVRRSGRPAGGVQRGERPGRGRRRGARAAHGRRQDRLHRLDRDRQADADLCGAIEHEARGARMRRQDAADLPARFARHGCGGDLRHQRHLRQHGRGLQRGLAAADRQAHRQGIHRALHREGQGCLPRRAIP